MKAAPLLEPPEAATCRICHDVAGERESGEALVSPCRCDGSVRWIHQRCLNQWRLQGTTRTARWSHCEICGFAYRYNVEPVPRGRRVCLLWANVALTAVLLAAAGLLGAVFATPRDGLMAVSVGLSAWAAWDALGSRRAARKAFQQVLELARSPSAADAKAEAVAQARAAASAEASARSLDMLRNAVANAGRAETSSEVELQAVHDESPTDSAADLEASAELSPADAPDPEGTSTQHDALGLGSGAEDPTRDSEEAGDADDVWSFFDYDLPDTDSAAVLAQAQRARVGRTCVLCLSPLCFAVPLLFGFVRLLGLASEGELGSGAIFIVAALGWGYLLSFLALSFALAMVGPQDREPVRGSDGFFLVRSLKEEERRAALP